MNMKNVSKTLAIALGAMVLAMSGATSALASPVIEVTMKNNGYNINSGGSSGAMTPGFTLSVGQENTVVLKNEDTTAHDFVSKSFNDLDMVVIGEAITIKDSGATGFRVMPGKSVKIKFTPRVTEGFSSSWDVFYCTIHGKADMKGEVIVADTRTGSGAF